MLVCHDLKNETDPVSPPLANGLRMVPVLFYVAVAGCAFFTAYFMIQKNAVERARVAQERITAEESKKIAQIQMKQKELETDVNKAKSMIEWVRGSDIIQPLAMAINKSIDPTGSTINSLKLSRSPENPWQIQMDLRLNGSDYVTSQLENTLLKIEEEKYKKFSPRRSQEEMGLTYSATLIKQSGS